MCLSGIMANLTSGFDILIKLKILKNILSGLRCFYCARHCKRQEDTHVIGLCSVYEIVSTECSSMLTNIKKALFKHYNLCMHY